MLTTIKNMIIASIKRYGSVIWSFPLRLMVAWFWIDEAGAKIWGETKWGAGDLSSGFGDDSWLVSDSVKMPFAWLQTETTSASVAAEGAAEVTAIAPPILDSMPGWFEAVMKLMMPTPEVAVFMQQMVPWVELILGVGILLGLFNWLCNFVSMSMLVMFTLSAMLGWDKFWALPASIALMSGSGRFLGLDYYIMPIVGKFLEKKSSGQKPVKYKDQAS
jgi:NADH dehydrogenase